MTQSCFDQASIEDAGANAEGLYLVGSSAYLAAGPADA